MGKPIGVYLRTPAQLETILRSHPFQSAAPNQVIVLFLDAAPAAAEVAAIKIPANEEIVAIGSEVYVHFPEGQGKSKLKLPFATIATGRNLNTLTKLLELAR